MALRACTLARPVHRRRDNCVREAQDRQMTGFVLDGYDPQEFYCEMLRCAATAGLRERLARMPIADFQRRTAAAEQALYDYGITFTLYAQNNAIDRILPFDAIPRVIAAAEWQQIETGIIQRITALNLLLDDLMRTALSGRSAIWIENPALRRPALKRTGPETRCPHQSGPWLDSTSA